MPNEGVNPHRIKTKDVIEVEVKEVFGLAKGRSGYSFVDYVDQKVLDTIKEINLVVYTIPKNKLIGKEFAKGIIIKIVIGKKMSWAGLAHETNANQRSKWSSWMDKCVEKKVTILSKITSEVKKEDGIVGLVKEEKKSK